MFNNFHNYNQIDLILLLESQKPFIEDALYALSATQSHKYYIVCYLHVISPFKDLLGNGTSYNNLSQYNLNKYLLLKLKKQIQLNSRLIISISDGSINQIYRFLLLDALQLSKYQIPTPKRIVAIDFRLMTETYLEYIFKMYGHAATNQQRKQVMFDLDNSYYKQDPLLESVNNYSDDVYLYYFNTYFEYLQNKLQTTEIEHQRQYLYDKAINILHKYQSPQITNFNSNQSALQSTYNESKAQSASYSMLQSNYEGFQYLTKYHDQNFDVQSKQPGKITFSSLNDLKLNSYKYNMSVIAVQYKQLQQNYEYLRKEKMIVESGKNKLIEENYQMKYQIVDLKESYRSKQLRIYKLEKDLQMLQIQLQYSQNTANEPKNEEVVHELNTIIGKQKNEIAGLKQQLQTRDRRVEYLIEQGKQLRLYMKLLQEYIDFYYNEDDE